MTYKELVEKMREVNKVYPGRFMMDDKGSLMINGSILQFTENNISEAYDFINEYGMFKRNEDCSGKQLYYKGIKWSDLTDEQRQSVIDLYKDEPNFVTDEREYEALFNDDRCFLVF